MANLPPNKPHGRRAVAQAQESYFYLQGNSVHPENLPAGFDQLPGDQQFALAVSLGLIVDADVVP